VKEGLAKMSKVKLYTPRDASLSAGIVCFDIDGMTQQQVVDKLHERKILASTTPYRVSYARVAFGLQNTTGEVERTLREIRALAA
jgi:isopenicillin-N epimerase